MSSSQHPPPLYHPSCPTFALPPLDGSLTLPDLYEWHSKNSPNHPLFVYEDEPGRLRTILYGGFIHGLDRAARLCTKFVGTKAIQEGGVNAPVPVVSIVGNLDSITYTCLLLGIMRSGCVAFPISPRNSPAAVAHLIQQTDSHHVFVSSDHAMQSLTARAKAIIPGSYDLVIHATPNFEELFPASDELSLEPNFVPPRKGPQEVATIYHSSGSTAFPKPIYWSNLSFVQFGAALLASEIDLYGKVYGVHGSSLFHVAGAFQMSFAVAVGYTVAVFKPQTPPVVPNAANVVESLRVTKAEIAQLVPLFFEAWARDENSISVLKQLKALVYGGGPLSQEAGDTLVSNGVNLVTCYGSTEVISVSVLIPKDIGKDWNYFKFHPERDVRLNEVGNNEYVPTILTSRSCTPTYINTHIDGIPGYCTNDILSPHPTRKGLWKVVGRIDDQLIHTTGEKTNPGPLEKILMGDPHVSGAVMFGHRRFNVGVLVSPSESLKLDTNNKKELYKFRNLIWPSIEKMNKYAPTHSRLFKEMIIITSPDKPFTYTGKGTIRRQACIKEYEAEINAVYDAVAECSQIHINAPEPDAWDIESIRNFVFRVIAKVMGEAEETLELDMDLFNLGLDSLQATWIRNAIFQALRKKHSEVVRTLSANIIYEHPTIARLAHVLSEAISGLNVDGTVTIEEKRQRLIALVDKYTQDIPQRPVTGSASEGALLGKVVLLTGGTGSLGSNILAHLLKSDSIVKVFALSRASPSEPCLSSRDKHVQAFKREDFPTDTFDFKVEFFDGDPSLDNFNLPKDIFDKLQAEVTHIIHSGWRVNFNVSIASFESNIKGVRNLVDFCVTSPRSEPPAIYYVSSVSVFQNRTQDGLAPETAFTEPDSAIGLGYGESKWVSERILAKAASKTALKATSIRCGQLTGGLSGAWNEHEWFPSLVKSSLAIRMFPENEGSVSWLSSYVAGNAIVDMLDARGEVFHIVHPKPTPWSDIASAFAKLLDIQVVSYDEWLGALEDRLIEAGTDHTKVERAFKEMPALRLMDFFREAKKKKIVDRRPFEIARVDSMKAQAASPTLREMRGVGVADIETWIAFWKKSGFLPI